MSLELVRLHSEVDRLVRRFQGRGAPPGDELLSGRDRLARGRRQSVAARSHVLQRVRRQSYPRCGRRGRRGQRDQRGRGQVGVQALRRQGNGWQGSQYQMVTHWVLHYCCKVG